MQINNQDKIKDLIQTTIQKDKNIGYLKDNLFYIPIIHSPGKFVKFLIIIAIISLIIFYVNKSSFYFSIIFLSIFLIVTIDKILNYDYLIFDLDNSTLYKSSFFLNKYKYGESEKMPSLAINNIKIETKLIERRRRLSEFYDYVQFVTKDDEVIIEEVKYSLKNHNLLTERYKLLANILGIKLNLIGDIEELKKEINSDALKTFLLMIIIGLILFFMFSK